MQLQDHNSAEWCVRKSAFRVTALLILNLCVRLIIWGLADMVRAGLSAIHFSTPFQGVKTGFSGGKHDKITFYTTEPLPVILQVLNSVCYDPTSI